MIFFRIAAIIVIIIVLVLLIWKWGKHEAPIQVFDIRQGNINHQGVDRTYSYYLPETLSGLSPLIIVLHRSKSNSSELRKMMKFRYEELADQKKFAVLYPDGYEGCWNDCRKAPGDLAHKKNIDDTGFINKLVNLFTEKYSIDSSEIYVSGMSGGGHMALRLANEIPGKIAAIAPTLAQLPEKANSRCGEMNQSLPVFLLNGTKDPISPYDGGEISLFGLFLRQGKVLSAQDTVNHFLKINGITAQPDISRIYKQQETNKDWVEKYVWKENSKPEVQQYIVHGGGHTLPGTKHLPEFIFGKTCDIRNIADDIVDFFLAIEKRTMTQEDQNG